MSLLLSMIAVVDPPVWVEFDRRPAGWADSPYEYEAGSVRREGPRVRVTYRYKFFYSGLPDPEYRVGIDINCVRWRTRVYRTIVLGGLPVTRPLMGRLRPRGPNLPTIGTPIRVGSIEDSLARRVCAAAGR